MATTMPGRVGDAMPPRPVRTRVYAIERRYIGAMLVAGAQFTQAAAHCLRLNPAQGTVSEQETNMAPPDARLVGITWDEPSGSLLVTLEHESFDEPDAVVGRIATPLHVRPTWQVAYRFGWRSYEPQLRGITLRDLVPQETP